MNESSNRLPDLYQLLGLSGLESDPQKITAAIKRLASKVQDASGAEPSRAQRVVSLAEKYLLDPAKKSAYDQQWKAIYRGAATSVPAPAMDRMAAAGSAESAWDMAQLNAILPSGDPQAPFNMAAYLGQSEARDPAAAEVELQRLMTLLGQDASAGVAQLGALATGVEKRDTEGLKVAAGRGKPGGARPPAPGSFATRMRQKQQRTLVLGGIGLGAGLLGLLGLGLFLMSGPQSTVAQRPKRPGTPAVATPPMQLDNAQSGQAGEPLTGGPAVLGSGLPQPGEQPREIQAPSLKSQTADAPTSTDATNAPVNTNSPTTMAAPSSPAANAPMQVVSPSSANPSSVGSSATSPMADKPSPASPPAAPEPAQPKPAVVDVQLTPADKEAWQKAMLTARGLIGELEFESADKQLESLAGSAKTAVQREQLERLKQIGLLVREAQQAMVQAIQGLSAAETFQIGTSTQASFVEGDATQITVKVAGQNRTFTFKEIPLAMAMALVDLKLDVLAATTKARKGAFVLVHPKNKTMLERGKQWMLEAADAGAITKEVAQFYNDDYSVP